MLVRTAATLAMAALLTATFDFTRRRPPAGAGRGRRAAPGARPARGPRTGTVEQIVVHGASLDRHVVLVGRTEAKKPARPFGHRGRRNGSAGMIAELSCPRRSGLR
jgi:hypothetical protein